MSDSMLSQAFSKGVGRRIVLLFLLAAIVPMLFTSWLAYHEFNRGVEREASRILKAQAKEYASEILTRLFEVSEKAEEIVRITAEDGINGLASNAYLLEDFEAIWLAEGDAMPVLIAGQGRSSVSPSAANDLFLQDRSVQLLLTPEKDLLLFKTIAGSDANTTNYVFFLKAQKIWGVRQELPYSAEFCIFSEAGVVLSCTSDVDPGLHAALLNATESRSSSFAEWTRGDEKQVAALWQLFLKGPFGARPIDIVAIQDLGLAMKAVADYWRGFLPAVALVLVLAGLLSLNLIARSLVPLRTLTEAARQLGTGNLAFRAEVSTRDEFQGLADAFNEMATTLGRQISTLEALSGIDRMILSGTKFEEVAEDVVKHLVGLINCNAAAVIVRDVDASHKAKMIS
ncbi:MAG: HAMP domain-containing protein, partial [Woeseiaceae bacterium]